MTKCKPEWRIIVEMLEKVDIVLLNRILRRMIYYLYKSNVEEIFELLKELEPSYNSTDNANQLYANVPNPKMDLTALRKFTQKVFQVAGKNIPDDEISKQINHWLAQERSRFLTIAIENVNIPLVDITEVLDRFLNIPRGESYLSPDEFVNIRVALARRFLSTNLHYINVAKHYIKVVDFFDIIENTIGPSRGSGKLGGKSAGLILAHKVIEKEKINFPGLENIRVPRSWYITSDTTMDFIHFNALEEIISLKYLEGEEIRAGYPYLQQLFKNSFFPPEIVSQLELLLEQIGERPIIVRSSSLLEDSFEAAFSGKYKSLFLSNSGDRSRKLNALLDAIAEIYASTFGPDPIEYRKERGLLDFQEEMGILIQEVVGTRIGKYFAPTFAGVAFSSNEFRWSPRIEREDGAVRMVMGLGTRAVDRVGDDYPYLASPGKPGLRINIKYEDVLKYSQKKIDVLNLETHQFETLDADPFLKAHASEIAGVEKIVSTDKHGNLMAPVGLLLDAEDADLVITFQNLTEKTPFFKQVHTVLDILKKAFKAPVDVEFASDGKDLYILQCRPQSQAMKEERADVPENIEADRLVFLGTKHVTSGYLPHIRYIIYVDPEAYNSLPTAADMKRTAAVISKLNKLIPRRSFILIGPGRWGSRGDIKLGVQVTYSDINNAAMLIELAYNKDGYIPEVSFGTHFFQDLVESNIKYLPLFPDEKNNTFNRELLEGRENQLLKFLPQEEEMAGVIRVVSFETPPGNPGLSVIMDSQKEKAVALISGET